MAGENEGRILQSGDVEIYIGNMDVFSCAMYQDGIPPIRGVLIANHTKDPIEGLSLVIMPDTEMIGERRIELPVILPGKPTRIDDPELHINGKQLAELTEAIIVNVKLALLRGDEFIFGIQGEIKILTYDQWMGENYGDYLPSFVMPNHPVVSGLLHDAAMILNRWREQNNNHQIFAPAIDGYQSEDPNRVRILAAAAYAAIQKKNIVYATSKANIWEEGQRIRTPEIIMEQRLGNCMDMTLLYAACLEAMGLHPLLYAIQGHIFTGLWLHNTSFPDMRLIENNEILKRCTKGSEEMIFIESTAMCAGNNVLFDKAEYDLIDKNMSPNVFDFAIDVFTARTKRIRPLFSRTMQNGKYEIQITERKEDEITSAPQARKIEIQKNLNTGKRKINNKKDLWETKLLDLSSHNMLLNLPYKNVEPILSSYVDELEDALADGEEFRLCPLPVEMVQYTVRVKDEKEQAQDVPLISFMLEMHHGPYEMTDWQIGGMDFAEKWRQEARSHRLYTYRTPAELEKNLTAIYRAASSSQQENGVSSLYIAVGLLRWIDEEAQEVRYAPLILVPIEIVRKSANQGYALHMRDEEPHFNLTLLEMLKQNHNIDIGGLDPLPADDHGVDIKRTFAIVRSHLQTVQGWDVIETCVVGNFSFAQFAMWNDIHRAGDMLEQSKIVRSLIKGHVDWNTQETKESAENIFLPITVDGTQLNAIQMAADGDTFVLHGPPGTGKSQTITGMIANLMAQGKSVLFVAEKMAALSVVEKRLTSLGIGDFCLELHSDKANKKHVLQQLDKALSNHGKRKKDEFEEYLRKYNASRDSLDQYMQHLHMPRNCGYSMHELIDLYETTSDQELKIPFTRDDVREMTRDQIKSHRSLLGRLTAAGDNVGDPLHHPLRTVGLDEYSFMLRTQVEDAVRDYLIAAESMRSIADETCDTIGLEKANSPIEYSKVLAAIECAHKIHDSNSTVRWLMDSNPEKVKDYLTAQKNLTSEKQDLLETWNEDFLHEDMMVILQRYEAAEKKLLGRNSAFKALASDLQRMSKKQILPDQIPESVKKVKFWQEKVKTLQRQFDSLSSDEKALVQYAQNITGLEKAIADADELRRGITASGLSYEELNALNVPQDMLERYRNTYNLFCIKVDELNRILIINTDHDDHQDGLMQAALYLQKSPSALKDWSIYIKRRKECLEAGLAPAVKAYEEGMKSREVYPAYRKGLYYALIAEVISTDEVLSTFSGSSFNESVRQFKQVDDALLQHTKVEIFNKLVERIPSNLDSPDIGMELNLLRKAIGSNARGMSIRNLFERLSHIIQRLCPVMLMSPNSVAQYLERKNDLFDVVIFDEASQLPTCKAVGALARAKAAVIVGDPKQMPPTSFFAGTSQLTDDLTLDDLDSILDDALALGIPSQYLQWHYRSTHESLIAFSNHEFYDNKMFTFPSANDRERHVTAVHVNGVYKNSVNAKEAEAIVQEIIRRYHDPELRKQSIGVVTFNVKQQDVIYNLLAKRFQQDPEMDTWANSGEDPIFVKNLENVQGDERDVILFSIGYGPDEKGHLSMNFGPINKAGGGKRLNVAFSRARISMMIFVSMYSSQIKVTDSSPDGLKAFQSFLHYAEGHSLGDVTQSRSDDEPGNGIMQRICNAIQEKGFECQTNIGQSSFHIDIAVVDPFDSTQYLLGILLDGENYRMTNNTRDREIAQVTVLKRLGWDLQRIWTIDWWDDPEKQIRQILEKLDLQKEAAGKRYHKKHRDIDINPNAKQEELEKELAAQAEEVIEDTEKEEDLFAAPRITNIQIPEPQKGAGQVEEVHEPVEDSLDEPTYADAPDESAVEENHDEADPSYVPETQTGFIAENPVAEGEDSNYSGDYKQIDYTYANLPQTPISTADYGAPINRKEITNRIDLLLAAEAPIHREMLIWKVINSFGIKRTTPVVIEATDKAIRASMAKAVKTKGLIFYWLKDSDPKAYKAFRVADRNIDEVSPHELKNAICYTLKQSGGTMDRNDLIWNVSRTLGYKRLGKNVEAALQTALQFAISSGEIEGTGQVSITGQAQASESIFNKATQVDTIERSNSSNETEKNEGIKIGKLARTEICAALEAGKISPDEIEKLQTLEYSHEVLGLNYPCLVKLGDDFDASRYYKDQIIIGNVIYYLCSQWYESYRSKLTVWIKVHL